MPKFATDARIIEDSLPLDLLKQNVYVKIDEQALLDVLNGISELNHIGIFKQDNTLENILLDDEGRAYIADFSRSVFVKPLSENFYKQRKIFDLVFYDLVYLVMPIEIFKEFLERRNISLQNDWSKIVNELKKPTQEALTTVTLAKLVENDTFRLQGKK